MSSALEGIVFRKRRAEPEDELVDADVRPPLYEDPSFLLHTAKRQVLMTTRAPWPGRPKPKTLGSSS